MCDLAFGVLGPVRVLRGGRRVGIGGKTTVAVLAGLLLSAGEPVSPDVLADLVWDADAPENPRAALHNAVWRLRRLLGRGVVDSGGDGYQIRPGAGTLDLLEFDELLIAADEQLSRGDRAGGLALVEDAVRLWRGPALENVGIGRLRRDRAPGLTERFVAAQELRARLALDLGRHRELVADLSELARSFPFREGLAGSLMLALYRCDRQADALTLYDDFRRRLAESLGVDPAAELRDLYMRILRDDPDLRVRGQLEVAAPRLPEAASAASVSPRQLPADIADFTGRDEELAQLQRIIPGGGPGSAGPRIAVIAGPGGSGKTALAVHAARRLQPHYPDGQLYVDLQGAGSCPVDPGEVLSRFLRAFGIAGTAIPADLNERAAVFRSVVAGRRVLMVLDNASGAGQLRQLLPGDAGCGVIVTARSRVSGLPGGQIIELGMLREEQAVRLLGRIAGEGRVQGELVHARALARMCGGLPLALRIAGARLSARPHWLLADLASRLEDGHRRLSELAYGDLSVQASLSLSYEGLPPAAATLLRRLSLLDTPVYPVWAGAALLDAGPGLAAELLDGLAEAQLLEVVTSDVPGERRYRPHDLTREFMRQRVLAEESPGDRDAALRRVLGAVLGLAEHAHRKIYGGDYSILHGQAERWHPGGSPGDVVGPGPARWLEGERLLITAAIRQAAESGLDELCWDLAWTAVTLFQAGQYLEDWGAALQQGLAAACKASNARGEAAMRVALASWLTDQCRYAEATAMADRGRRLFARAGDQHGQALADRTVALCEGQRGRLDSALALFMRARAVLRAAGDRFMEAGVLRDMAGIYLQQGELGSARRCLAAALPISQEIGSPRAQAMVLHRLGQVSLQDGLLEEAERSFGGALESARQASDKIGETYSRFGLAEVQLARGGNAEPVLRDALQTARRLRHYSLQGQILLALGKGAQRRDDHDAAERWLRASAEITSRHGLPLWQARALDALAAGYRARHAHAAASRAELQASQIRQALSRQDSSG